MPRPDTLVIAVLLTALVTVGPLSTDLYLPALPVLEQVFDTDVAAVQLTLSVFLVGFALSQLVYGPLSDRYGRRPILLGGVAVFVVASFACAVVDTIDQLIAARFFQACGACSAPVLSRAVVRDVFQREEAARMLSYIATAMAVAPAVAPMIGGWLTATYGWRANFLLLTGFGVVVLAGAAVLLTETNQHRDPRAINPARLIGNYLQLATRRRFLGYALCMAFVFSGIFAFISGSSFILIGHLHLSPVQFGLSFGVVVLGFILGSFASARLGVRLGIDRLVLIGTELAGLGGALGLGLALAGELNLAAVLGPLAVFMAGAGLTLPNAIAGAIAPFPTIAGSASALLGFIQMMVAATVGILVGLLHDGSPLPMMATIFVVTLIGGAAYRGLIGTRPPSCPG